jgi:hypothetical protein
MSDPTNNTQQPMTPPLPRNADLILVRTQFEAQSLPASARGFFGSLPWFRHLADTIVDRQHILRIYSATGKSESEPAALMLPMFHRIAGRRWFQRLAPRRLQALANYYSPLFEPLLQPAPELALTMTALVARIAQERPRWDTVDLHPMDSGDPLFPKLEASFRAAGMAVQRYFCFGNWYLEVNGRSYDAYFESLPSKLRHTLKRKSASLAARLRIDIVTGSERLEQTIAAYEAVYLSSWKPPETFPAFIPELMRLCAAQGSLRLGVAYIDEQPAAAQFWIVHNGVASIYKLAYHERLARLSAGSILTAALMRHAIDIDAVREVDFLSGDDIYKSDWMPHRRERWGLTAFNLHTTRGILLALKNFGGRGAKRCIHAVFRSDPR